MKIMYGSNAKGGIMVELFIVASLGRIRRLRFEENLEDPIRKPHFVEDPWGNNRSAYRQARGDRIRSVGTIFAKGIFRSDRGISIGEPQSERIGKKGDQASCGNYRKVCSGCRVSRWR